MAKLLWKREPFDCFQNLVSGSLKINMYTCTNFHISARSIFGKNLRTKKPLLLAYFSRIKNTVALLHNINFGNNKLVIIMKFFYRRCQGRICGGR